MVAARGEAVKRVASFIASDSCKSIAVLTGAGISVAAGIPDFRSPGGMYSTLKPELITATAQQRLAMARDPTSVVMKDMFFQNAFPYLEVRRPFILGTRDRKWKATLAHRTLELLHAKFPGKLKRLYTQNIDGLDFQLDLPPETVVPVHGTIGKVACEACGAAADFGRFCDDVSANIKDLYEIDSTAPAESTPITCAKCGRPTVKPTTVLFGGSLPEDFFARCKEDLPTLDLLLVAGTSLVVSPANSLPASVPETTVRLVVNNERVGAELGIDYSDDAERDIFCEGAVDDVFLALADELNWLDDLEACAERLPEASLQRLRALQASKRAARS